MKSGQLAGFDGLAKGIAYWAAGFVVILAIMGKKLMFRVGNRAEAEAMLGELARETESRARVVGALDAAILKRREKAQPLIGELNGRIAAREAALEAWADRAKGEFGDKRSVEMRHGVIGYRKGQRALGLLSRWTWAKVLELLQKTRKLYVREKFEVNREQILIDSKGDKPVLSKEELSEMGVKIMEGDNFYIDLKQERAQ